LLSTGELTYDELVIATGTKSNFFCIENIKKNAMSMNSGDDGVLMRNNLLQKGEKATFTSEVERDKLRNVVISGVGPTCVEVARMLPENGTILLERIFP